MGESPIGAIMHDGWSKVSTYYFALYCCYNWKAGRWLVPTCVRLAMAPFPKADPDENSNLDDKPDNKTQKQVGKSPEFDAIAHANFICSTFEKYYGDVTFDSWCVAQVSNNASVNPKIAWILGIKHIGCKNHQLALDVKDMFKEDVLVSSLVDAVHNTMSSVKRKTQIQLFFEI